MKLIKIYCHRNPDQKQTGQNSNIIKNHLIPAILQSIRDNEQILSKLQAVITTLKWDDFNDKIEKISDIINKIFKYLQHIYHFSHTNMDKINDLSKKIKKLSILVTTLVENHNIPRNHNIEEGNNLSLVLSKLDNISNTITSINNKIAILETKINNMENKSSVE